MIIKKNVPLKIQIKNKFKYWIKKVPIIHYSASCIINYRDKDIRAFMCDGGYNIIHLIQENCQTGKKPIYFIKTGNQFSGFGAELRRNIDALAFADYLGIDSFIEYTSNYIYSENEMVNNTKNPFEYYFIQPCNALKAPLIEQNYNIIRYKESHRNWIYDVTESKETYTASEAYLEYAGKIIKKYIKLNPETTLYIERSMEEVGFRFKKTIGVHIRGTDFNIGYKEHPKAVGMQDYYEILDSLLEDQTIEQIFLATDEEDIAKEFVNKYGSKVVRYEDVYRSEDKTPVHFSNSSRPLHKYKLGLEVLRDIITLSKCGGLICGLSQVSYCARMFKFSEGINYRILKIIDKGLN